ncbi:MAG TPA: HAMP domain-containing sensor histidine kinase [Solirubrobacteraceae bacterium]|nr:HAMP domain-containing sensor histidine kinase [Solirubrobacteraceae bacterium]
MRRWSLHVWLVAAFALAVVVPATVAGAAWLIAGSWQDSRQAAREQRAIDAINAGDVSTPDSLKRLALRLSEIGVEAQVGPRDPKSVVATKEEMANRPILQTSGFLAKMDDPAGGELVKLDATAPAVIWVPAESAAARWAITIGAATAALVAALAVIVFFLRRWVLAPLAGLAADADRIAGGELDVTPMSTRAREVAQVGDAMQGMARALGTALEASAAAERDRRFLVTAIAHDLRTPLFTLRGSLEALEHGIGDDGRYLGLAQDRATHLDRLVTDLFAFSRLEYAHDPSSWAEVDVAALAREIAEALSGTRDVRVAAGGADRAIVRGDAQALQRVLTNLLDNAIRHGRAQVQVTTARANGTVTVGVVDDGPGFDDADLPHVFEPLFRGDRARSGSHAGLGLAIARRLARAHGGDVDAANAAGGGAQLTVRLPAA